MRRFLSALEQFKNDEAGNTLIEYTALIGLMLVAVVATISLVGAWVSAKWTALNTAL